VAKRILLIVPDFYGIEYKIKTALEAAGNEVILIENKSQTLDYHGTRAKCKFLRRAYFYLFSPGVKYLRREFKKIQDLRFDILFSINCFVISPYIFKKLKKTNHNIYSVLYLWDSFSMYDWEREVRLFDKAYTFDRTDSLRYNIEYKPNFYLCPDLSSEENEFDLFFAGKFSSQRFLVLNHIFRQINDLGLSSFIRLSTGYRILFHNKIIYFLLRNSIFKNKWIKNYLLNYEANEGLLNQKFLTKDTNTYDEIRKILKSSNVILDLPFEHQSGFTHRIIEALANGKKILTTNYGIITEDFYNSEQIKVLDTENVEMDFYWIREKATFPVHSIIQPLELSIWLKSILKR
jgi:hypothetical protein